MHHVFYQEKHNGSFEDISIALLNTVSVNDIVIAKHHDGIQEKSSNVKFHISCNDKAQYSSLF
jgi:hypothetical protein